MIKEKIRCSLDIEEEVLHYIASKEDSNIRDLEGALKKVIASAQLENSLSSINMEIARRALKDFFVEPVVKTITPKLVVRCVCEYYDLSLIHILLVSKMILAYSSIFWTASASTSSASKISRSLSMRCV